MNEHVKVGHGPLATLTPQRYVSEGDTPSFLHLVKNGLDAHRDYTLGGWGGRGAYTDPKKFPNHLSDKSLTDDDDAHKMFWRWVPAAQNDFAARLDWCVKTFEDANHAPVAQWTSEIRREVKPGETIRLSATASDPDGDDLKYKWWQYADADSAKTNLTINNSDSLDQASFVVPDEAGTQVQVIFEVTDNGTPPLVGYQRILFSIK